MYDRVAIVVPVYNEEASLTQSMMDLSEFLQRGALDDCDVIVTDNNSTDASGRLARELAETSRGGIRHHFVAERGKGAAIKDTWAAFDGYAVYCFMDVDLAADLEALPRLIEEVRNGCGIAIGSRYARGAKARRSWCRKTISVVYRLLFDLLFQSRILDPQCGFKAISREVRDRVLPRVKSNGFFFDTELILRARADDYTVKELPIRWTEKPSSTVRFLKVVPEFLVGLAKLKYEQWIGKLGKEWQPVTRRKPISRADCASRRRQL